ncbi:TPA: energy transducer TonB [Mannheimia haemolytica]|uniref:TonB family protein n=1 Tax=Mannheimia haemolytica TaxID=75985 RepID=UPI0011BB6B3E|nr:energy transducer TonB [Mannheimia haemolytica]QEB26442.1 energy transducer TonB [Mannheimia haemolytica]HDL4166102.1 energy transducer TonB [Mannheimia haemolytica]HDL6294055.1 energy transducer TonB [Mannheimia haemolytica]
MKKKHSRIGLLASLAIHTALIGGTFAWLHNHKVEKIAEQNSLSMEMVAALLEQPQVAVAPDPITEEVKEIEPEKAEVPPEPKLTPEPTPEPEAIPDPTLNPKKEKPKDKPKERPKHHHKHIKALERGPEIKQGIVAKAIPNAAEGEKVVAGVVGGQKNGSPNSTSTTGSANTGASSGNASELAAYKVALQRALQRKANNSYPQREKMMRKTGTVTIKFTITSSGSITNVSVLNSSGNSNLDNAAVRSAEGLSMPPPPAGFPPTVTVPVRFALE